MKTNYFKSFWCLNIRKTIVFFLLFILFWFLPSHWSCDVHIVTESNNFFLVHCQSCVNFINVKHANFTYESAFWQLFLLTCNCQKDVRTKYAHVKHWWNCQSYKSQNSVKLQNIIAFYNKLDSFVSLMYY